MPSFTLRAPGRSGFTLIELLQHSGSHGIHVEGRCRTWLVPNWC